VSDEVCDEVIETYFMRLGIGTYTCTWAIGVPGHLPARSLTPIDLLDEARRLEVGVVQFCDNLPLTNLPPAELDRFHALVRSLGLTIELGTRGLEADNLRRHLRLAQRFGCPFLRLVVDSKGDQPSAEEVVARLKPSMHEFTAARVLLALENHDRFPSAALAWVIEQLGREHAGICLDTVNSFGALEGPELVVETLGRYTLCLHVKDFTIRRPSHNMGFVVEGCAAGQGRLDVPWLLEKLANAPHPFNAILETWVTPGNSLDDTLTRERLWTEQGVAYLRQLIPD
jgi:3-oxoisoapionate decarboxylase